MEVVAWELEVMEEVSTCSLELKLELVVCASISVTFCLVGFHCTISQHTHSTLFHLGGYGGYGGGAGGFFPGGGQKAAKRGTADGRKCLNRNVTFL